MNRLNPYRRFIISLLLLLFILFFTNPGKGNLNVLILIVPFLLLFIVLQETAKLIFGRLHWPGNMRVRRVVSAAIASIMVVALMLQSLGQLTLRDFILLSSLAVLLVWYLSQNSGQTRV